MPTSPIVLALDAFAIATCVFALWKGGPAEKIAALFVITNLILWTAGDYFLSRSMQDITLLVADAVTALGLLAVTVRFGSPWLGGSMLLYSGLFALHAYYFVLAKPTNDNFHIVVNNLAFLGVVTCVAVGTVSIVLRRRRFRPRTTSPIGEASST